MLDDFLFSLNFVSVMAITLGFVFKLRIDSTTKNKVFQT